MCPSPPSKHHRKASSKSIIEEGHMGLAERRAAKNFETNFFPQLKKQIDTAAHFEVPVEVRWDTLSSEDQAHMYEECWPKVYFQPLIEAIKRICIDDMGQEALKGSLKKIVIQNTNGTYSGERWAHFADGVLTLDHEPTTNVDSIDDRTNGLTQVLEKAL
jgi:hypothetical protein